MLFDSEEVTLTDAVEVENRAWLGRVTCGWKLAHLSLDRVRPYWRDTHSPAIARRAGIYEYRHYPLDPVRADLFTPIPNIDYTAEGPQLMWLSDVRYADADGLDAFGRDPDPHVRAQILGDIEMIVDKSTTYRVLGANGRTLVDRSGDPAPLGPVAAPTFAVFLRRRGEEAAFHAMVSLLAVAWAKDPAVVRVRLNLFETPDMEAERAAGYPVKTHPPDQQYQAWIDLVIEDEAAAKRLLAPRSDVDYASNIALVHAYPVPAVYTFNQNGRPTLAGLRGYAACLAIEGLGAEHQKDEALLQWMYGPVARANATL